MPARPFHLRQLICVIALVITAPVYSQSLKLGPPKKFMMLDSTFATPDAMAFDGSGNIYLSVTNATTYEKYGAKIIKLTSTGKILKTWDALPKHPPTGKVHPMGMAIASDGFLYVVDNQSFAGVKHSSRILRSKLSKGDLGTFEIVVTGLNVANGLRFHKGNIYVTDAWTDNDRKSGLYRFDLRELDNTIKIDASNRSKYLVHEMSLSPATASGVGMDGLDFDAGGNVYVGNFSEGSITMISQPESSQRKITTLVQDKSLIGCDGIFFDEKSNSLLIANFMENSVLQYNLRSKSLTTLWKNGDASCTADLDCPCDLAVVNNTLVVVNFDTYTTNANKTIDNCNTITAFEITW